MSERNVLIFDSPHALSAYLVQHWIKMATYYIERTGRFSCAFSGGRTPVEFYNLLSSTQDFDLWSKVHIFLTDERFVDQDDKDNNFRLLRDNLLNYVKIPPENIYPIPTNVQTAGISAEEYKNRLAGFFTLDQNRLPIIDMVLLGVGEDGHTASLFPDTQGIDDPYRLTMPVAQNHLKHERISITLPVINNAKHVCFMVTGKGKAEIIKDIVDEGVICPASRVNPSNGELVYLLDADAAHLLANRDKYLYRDQVVPLN